MKRLPIRDARIKLFLLSLMHLATDGLCAYLMFEKLYPENPERSFLVFIGYNFLAFLTQSPLGIWIDKHNHPHRFLGISVVAILLGFAFRDLGLLAVLLIGLGNAFFHIAGGKYVTDKSGNDISHLGIFVSTGAIGLTLGQSYRMINGLALIFFGLLIGCSLILWLSEDTENKTYAEKYKAKGSGATAALLAVTAVVLARSFVGKVASADFELTQPLLLLIALATALGKAFGGIVSRWIGTVPTVIASMSVAAVCLTAGCTNPYAYLLGVFAFNFSMPITLYYANILLKGKEGFAFGTLAAALIPGYLLAMTFHDSVWINIVTVALCFGSVLVIAIIAKGIHHADRTVASDSLD